MRQATELRAQQLASDCRDSDRLLSLPLACAVNRAKSTYHFSVNLDPILGILKMEAACSPETSF